MARQIGESSSFHLHINPELKKEAKEYLGENISEQVRKVLQDLVDKAKKGTRGFTICYCCGKEEHIKEQMYVMFRQELDEDRTFLPIICRDCFVEILKTPFETFKKIAKQLEENKKLNREEAISFRKAIIKLGICDIDKKNKSVKDNLEMIEYVNQVKELKVINHLHTLLERYPHLYTIKHGMFIIPNKIMEEHFDKHLKGAMGINE